MKKLLSLLTATILAGIMLATPVAAAVEAFATNDTWSVGWTEGYGEYIGWSGQGAQFAIDTSKRSKNNRYSIRMSNKEKYNYCTVTKTVKVEPNTTYKFSAMVKYSDYQADPDSNNDPHYKGAFLRAFQIDENGYWNLQHSQSTAVNEWKKLECEITTLADQTELIIELFNGTYDNLCMGTAWFTDIKFEKAELSNEWNVLAIVYKNVDATFKINGKKKHITDSFNNSQVEHIKRILKKVPAKFDSLSEGQLKMNKIDIVVTETPLSDYNELCIDYMSNKVTSKVDKQLKKKKYNQILIYAPFDKINKAHDKYVQGTSIGWYKGMHVAQFDYTNTFSTDLVAQGTVIHEMLHGLETRSQKIAPETPELHSYLDEGIQGEENLVEWYGKYMTRKLKGKKGLHPDVFYVPNGEYTLIDDDMTTGGLIKPAPKLDIEKCTLGKINDQIYTGNRKIPKITITDGSYTLKRDIDFTIKCANNKNIGKATVTITGIGLYEGTLTGEFNVVPEKTKLNVKKGKSSVTLSWNEVQNAEKYAIWMSTDDGEYKKVCIVDADTLSKKVKYSKGHKYKFAITAYVPELDGWTDYVYSKTV